MKNDEQVSYQVMPGIMITPESLIEKAAEKYNVTVDLLKSRSRKEFVNESRQYAQYLIRKELGLTLEKIGVIFDRDHATILHSCRVISERIQFNQLLVVN